jgi:hypothetical protein
VHVIALFAAVLALVLAASAWRLAVHGVSRTPVDRIVHGVTQMSGVAAEAIVLSDSVTAGPAYAPKPAPGVYPMLTVGYLRLAGQYLLFRRFVEDNTTRRMYLFMHPTLLAYDVSDIEGGGLARYTYIDSVFTRPAEKRLLAQAGAAPARPIESRFERLLKTWQANHFPRPFSADLYFVTPSDDAPRRDPAPRLPAPLTPQIRFFLEHFEADCRDLHIECTLVQSPTRPGIPRYDMAALGLAYPGLRFIDTHDFGYFPAAAFPDGWHLDRANGDRYVRMIQRYVGPIFAAADGKWDGSLVEFGHVEAFAVFGADTYHDAEAWGAWSSAPVLRMRFQAAVEMRGGEFRMQLRVPPQPDGAPVPLSVWLDGEEVASARFPDPAIHTVIFPLGERVLAAGSTHVLEVRVPRAVNLSKLGMSSDPRDLGPGIASIVHCVPGRCGWN